VDLTLSFALSESFDKISDLSRAWQQLQFIHALRGVDYMMDVKQIKDISPTNIQLPLNINMLEMLYNSLCNANDGTACSILRDCQLPESDDELITSIIHNRLSNMIMQMKLENPAVLFEITVPEYVRGKQKELFEEEFPECFRQICEKLRATNQNSVTKFGQEIIGYINEHIYNPDLYITLVSDHFDISPPTLQKLVKKISGLTFLAYVEKQRLTKAHEMLSGGKHTVQEVAVDCGFSNTNSFYKAFKRTFGFPPSDMLNNKVI
jgi:AraC-like DNA-binding protein